MNAVQVSCLNAPMLLAQIHKMAYKLDNYNKSIIPPCKHQTFQ